MPHENDEVMIYENDIAVSLSVIGKGKERNRQQTRGVMEEKNRVDRHLPLKTSLQGRRMVISPFRIRLGLCTRVPII